MSFWAKAISLAVGSHPTLALVIAVAVVMALQQAGVIPDGDWWGNGMEVRR